MHTPTHRGSGAIDLDALIARTAPRGQSARPTLDLDALIAKVAPRRVVKAGPVDLPDLPGWRAQPPEAPEVGLWVRGNDVLALVRAADGWVVRQTRWRHPAKQGEQKPQTVHEIEVGHLDDALAFLGARARDPMSRPEWSPRSRASAPRHRSETLFKVHRQDVIPVLLERIRAAEGSEMVIVVAGESEERVYRRERRGWAEVERRPLRSRGSRAIDLDALIARTSPRGQPARPTLDLDALIAKTAKAPAPRPAWLAPRPQEEVVPAVLPQVLTAEGLAQIDPEQRWRFPRAVMVKKLRPAEVIKRLAALSEESERRYDAFVRTTGSSEARLAAYLRLEEVLEEAWDLYRTASQMLELHEWATTARWQREHKVPREPWEARKAWFDAHPQAKRPERPGWKQYQAAGMRVPRLSLAVPFRRSSPGPHWFPVAATGGWSVPNADAVVLTHWWTHVFGQYLYPTQDEIAKQPHLKEGRKSMQQLADDPAAMTSFLGWQFGISGAGGTWFGGESSHKGGKNPSLGISSARGFRGMDPEKEERTYRTPKLVALAQAWLRAELAQAAKKKGGAAARWAATG